ncbi:MAG: endonuclease/exonuclease/phosphatase family protein [Clostridia bacterium]
MKALKMVGWILVCLVSLTFVAALLYAAQVWFSYARIPDDQPLAIDKHQEALLPVGRTLNILTDNIGAGVYTADYDFFMDGGTQSRGKSQQATLETTDALQKIIAEIDPELILLQEVDQAADRSFHVDQAQSFVDAFSDYASVFATNYDSAFLFYPVTHPIGKTRAGMMTLSKYRISEATRKQLPIESGFKKLLDLDRCISIARLETDNGRYLSLINLHPSAYVEDQSVLDAQLAVLASAYDAARAQGDYVICGGDFNHDLLGGTSPTLFGFEATSKAWLHPLDEAKLPDGARIAAPTNAPTVRDSGTPYVAGETFVAVIDGFIVSPDIDVVAVETVDNQFAHSDHNPVLMSFVLN